MSKNHKQLFKRPEVKKNSPEEIEEAEKVEEVESVEEAEEESPIFEGVWDEEYPYDKAYLDETGENGRHIKLYYEMIPMSVIEAASKDSECDGVMIFFFEN